MLHEPAALTSDRVVGTLATSGLTYLNDRMYQSPSDFARYVHAYLVSRGTASAAPLLTLEAISEALFSASLHSEEGRPISCHFAYLDPDKPDPNPPQRIVRNRWNSIPLTDRVPLTPADIAKLALATDPRTSSLAIYAHRDHRPFVWGLIDQANEAHAFSVFDSESGAERPGVFHVSILGPGHISASDGFVRLLELRNGRIIRDSIPVLDAGPVRALLQPHIDASLARIRSRVTPAIYDERGHWDASLTSDWLQTLARLLNRIQSHGHGGAILIVHKPAQRYLKVKYTLHYARLRKSIEDGAVSRILATAATDEIQGVYLEPEADDLPTGLYLEETVEGYDAEESKQEMNGALWFISLLSRVDGLILMQPDLTVLGFGAEITCTEAPVRVLAARDRYGRRLVEQSYEHYGTRHRSMMRFCHLVPGSLGFVVSQDGAIRAITRVKKRLVIWENLRLRLERFARIPSGREVTRGAT